MVEKLMAKPKERWTQAALIIGALAISFAILRSPLLFKSRLEISQDRPIQVPGVTNVVAISAASAGTIALKADGTVWVDRYYSSEDPKDLPPLIELSLPNVVAVSAGLVHAVVLTSDGTAWAWGDNLYGQLGGSHEQYVQGGSVHFYDCFKSKALPLYPVCPINGLAGATAIAAGGAHTIALERNGTVVGWGADDFGQLGIDLDKNANDATLLPARVVPNLTNMVAVAAGFRHSVALKSDGTVWMLGNDADSLFDSAVWDYGSASWYAEARRIDAFNSSPRKVPGLTNIISIAASHTHSLALKKDGTVWAWGESECGALGIAPVFVPTGLEYHGTFNHPAPVQVLGLGEIIAIAAGSLHSVALKSDGTVWAWGANGSGQLGPRGLDSTVDNSRATPCLTTTHWNPIFPTPAQVPGIAGVVAIAAGGRHTVALKKDGTLWVWGSCAACNRARDWIRH